MRLKYSLNEQLGGLHVRACNIEINILNLFIHSINEFVVPSHVRMSNLKMNIINASSIQI
jgi:hypothetical protein